jgi:toxin ParE1/3/4
MPTVVVRPRALVDLAEIWVYIADDNVEQADAFADLIGIKFQALADHPGIGRSRPELATDIRSFAVGRYVIFYISNPDGIDVVRVLHGARDLEAILQEEASPHDPS